MNKRFAPLYTYVARHAISSELIRNEELRYGNLSDLAFLAHYYENGPTGSGRIAVYRLSQGRNHAPIEAGNDNQLQKLWFIEDSDWRVLRHQPPRAGMPQRFCAVFAYNYDGRPVIAVDMDRPLVSIHMRDLPPMSQYTQKPMLHEQLLELA